MSPKIETTRREFLQTSLAAAGATVALSAVPGTADAKEAKPKRPNIVYFLGEGQRADAMSIAGHKILKTPNHDRIGKEGIRFTNAFVTNALCAPARAVALTGMYSASTGALANNDARKPLPSDIPILTDLLHEAGYEVAIVGKIHIRNGVEERYWDYYFGHNSAGNDYWNPEYKEGRNGKIGQLEKYHNVYADNLAVDKAIAWLNEERGDKPFCLLVWFVTPHAPFYRDRNCLDLYNGTPIPKPATFDDDFKGYPGKPRCFAEATNKIGTTVANGDCCRSLEELAKDYYAGLVSCDINIGKVMAALEKKGVMDDTAILHSSDHGYFLGEWRMYDKRLMHEPSIRVPLQIRYPKRIPAGTVRSEMVIDTDVAPTLLDIAGIKPPAHMQGKSLMPLAAAPDPNFRKEWYYEYYEFPSGEMVRPHRGIRTERYKYIHYIMDPQEFEMYDLQEDPGEVNNLYGKPDHMTLQNDLAARMEKLRQQIPVRST